MTDATVAPTSQNYFAAFLNGLGLPVTQSNLDALYSVEHLEGDNDRYNPLNVIQTEPGSTSINNVGVQRFASFATGVQGAVTLFKGAHWAGVRKALAASSSTQDVLDAFADAYTWDPGIKFPSSSSIDREEAGRNVGSTGSLSSQIGSINGDPSSIANLDAADTSTGGGVVGVLAGGISDLLPFGIGKGISAAEGAVVTTVTNYATKFAFIGGGMILVILGLVRASAPVRKQATDTLGQVAPLAAAAA